MDKVMLQKWLKAGVMEFGKFQPTIAGTPQGGIVTPIKAPEQQQSSLVGKELRPGADA